MLTHSAEPDEGHTEKYQDEVQGFGAKVSLTEDDGSAEEGYDHRTAAHKRDD